MVDSAEELERLGCEHLMAVKIKDESQRAEKESFRPSLGPILFTLGPSCIQTWLLISGIFVA